MPTQAMGPDDKDYAVSFSAPADAEGLFMIVGRQSCDTRKLENTDIDVGNAQYGGVELLVVFDDVFIPNENIYLNGETEFATMMVERFAGYHRQSYGGCKVGVGDVLIGASAVAADYNGVAKASHVKDKLIEMIHLNETMYSCGIACSAEGTKTASGNYLIDLLLANVCKQNVTRFPYEMARIAEDLAGGSVGTCLSEADLRGIHRSLGGQIHEERHRHHRGKPHADSPPHRKPLPGFRRRGLPHRVPPRGRFSPGPAGYDRPPGGH